MRPLDLLKEIQEEAEHCKKGHRLTKANIYRQPNGYAVCKLCRASQMSAYYQRRKARKQAA